MQHRSNRLSGRPWPLRCCLPLLRYLLLCTVFGSGADVSADAAPTRGSNATDLLALLAFKDRIVVSGDPDGALRSWNESLHFCSWQGVRCAGGTGRVRALDLPSRRLAGSLSPSLGNLTFLRELNLGDNLFAGAIPPELGRLRWLRTLNLTTNSLGGEIPGNLSNCKQLKVLDLATNALVGRIPTDITTLPELEVLYLLVNNLTGVIPQSVGNLSSLTVLAAGRNALRGRIPEEIGLIAGLRFLQIAENQLSGAIPRSLTNLSSLYFLTIAANQLEGGLPEDMGAALPHLETLYVADNQLRGHIPASLPNASGLQNLDFAYNYFTGTLPAGIGRLGGLLWLNLEGNNQLGGGGEEDGMGFIASLANCTRLEVLDIASNSFQGEMPATIANLSSRLSMLVMGDNLIRGSIPEGIKNIVGLRILRLERNLLSGRIPASVGSLQGLQTLSLLGNRLSGQIPSNIGNLTLLNDLRINGNGLEGSIPSSLGACRSLQFMDAAQNRLNGTIPTQLLRLSSLSRGLRLAHNALVGLLPAEVGNLKNLGQLDLSENRLSGELPASLGDCQSLEYLDMAGNSFSGSVPPTLNKLRGIEYIDLSRNRLTGQIPEYLGHLQALQHLNLSSNDLHGEVPQSGVFRNASAVSVAGNGKLCGGVPGLRLASCRSRNRVLKILVPVLCAVSALIVLSCASFAVFLWFKRRTRRDPHGLPRLGAPPMPVSYGELFRATDGFSPANLIGAGSYGAVYTGVLPLDQTNNIMPGNTIVAIKVLNLDRTGAYRSFAAECEALRNVRHRNLVRIFTSCSSVDHNGDDFRALVFEFMPNGSLEQWLHQAEECPASIRRLTIAERLSIATDVACAIDYLHHQSHVPIVHCDLKPSNVLLDDDMTARVGDFGLARIFSDGTGASPPEQSSTARIRGTIGYIPPEYGMGGDVSTAGDVYSYGVLLLELLTGLRPTDGATLEDGSTLHERAKMAFPERVMEILDAHMPPPPPPADSHEARDCVVSAFRIGIRCSAASPRERMDMGDVAIQMSVIRDTLLQRGGLPVHPAKASTLPG